ncbi:MAG: hypothetical protein LBR87_00705 [Synergistaceae bacterium]|jgi:hypothetical protein|nr:hypothetical protein [Synergistaceae bacterium]
MARKDAAAARRMVIRALSVLALAALAVLMYKIGREFDMIIDNGSVVIDGREYAAMDYGTVIIDNGRIKDFDMWADDRVIKKMVGAEHVLTVKVINEDDDSVIKTVERRITLDFNTRAEMISIPAITNEAENIRVPNPLYSPEPVAIPDDPPSSGGTEDGLPGGGMIDGGF